MFLYNQFNAKALAAKEAEEAKKKASKQQQDKVAEQEQKVAMIILSFFNLFLEENQRKGSVRKRGAAEGQNG